MGTFTGNPHRVNPYRGFKFRVRWDGRYVAGVSRVSAAGNAMAIQKLVLQLEGWERDAGVTEPAKPGAKG